MDFKDMLKKAFASSVENRLGKNPLAKLTAEEEARMVEIIARAKAVHADWQRGLSKIESEKNRWWADVKDNHSLHGKNLHYKDDTAEIYEILDEE